MQDISEQVVMENIFDDFCKVFYAVFQFHNGGCKIKCVS